MKNNLNCLRKWPAMVYLIFIALFVSGCDVFFVKRIDVKNQSPSKLIVYNYEKDKILSVIDQFISDNNFVCQPMQGMLRYCNNIPRKIVVFNDKAGEIVVCLFKVGTSFEYEYFFNFVGALKNLLTTNISNIKLIESDACKIPQPAK